MSFLNIFSPRAKVESIILIDISAGSVAGAYAHYGKNETPELLYTRRVQIETRDGEAPHIAMERTLEILGSYLIREGAPILMRHSGRGSADSVLVSVEAPWQETKIHTEKFERSIPFIFTKKMLALALEKTNTPPNGKILADESILGTSLNGYHIKDPFGMKAHRASVLVLTSFIDENISKSISASQRSMFHTDKILSIAGSSLRYQAIRNIFPHEHSAIILDAIGPLLSIALVRKDFLVAVTEIANADSDNDLDVWMNQVTKELISLSERYPLPRTIFLVTPESKIKTLEKLMVSSKLGGLWLSEDPPKVVPVLASHIVGSIKQVTTASPDLQLQLMALYWLHRSSSEKM